MDAWKRLGSWISRHMVFVVPLCIVVGVFFPHTLIPLRPAIPTLFAIVTFQNALRNDFKSLRDTFGHPQALLITLALVHVVAPLTISLVARALFGANPDTVVGLVLECCVPVGATTVMWSGVYGGNVALALAMMFISTTIAPFTIPWTLRLLVGATVEVDVVGMMGDMLYMVGIPAVAGVVFNEASHGWGKERLSPVMASLSSILVPIIIATNATGISKYVLNLTPWLVAVAAFVGMVTVLSVCMGLLVARLTRQPPDTTVTMAFDCGIRNISAGAVLAAAYLPAESLFPVMIGTLFQQLIAAIVGKTLQRRMGLGER
ncbi:MAG: bile acid:sodium symporter family protein [Atopobiaceae bacterium]|nr:bile acid:sodium symporter family protein [Atopobiaceae bacterium]